MAGDNVRFTHKKKVLHGVILRLVTADNATQRAPSNSDCWHAWQTVHWRFPERNKNRILKRGKCIMPNKYKYIYIYRVSHELRSPLRESVPYVKIYRYNPKHPCPKLNGYGDNGQRKVLTSCISAYCTSSAVSALTLTEHCSRHLCECTSSAQRDKIVLNYCQIFMLYVQCLVTLRTTMTWVWVFL